MCVQVVDTQVGQVVFGGRTFQVHKLTQEDLAFFAEVVGKSEWYNKWLVLLPAENNSAHN